MLSGFSRSSGMRKHVCVYNLAVEVGCPCLPKWFVDEATNHPLLRFTWFPLTKPHPPCMPHHSCPVPVLHRASGTEGQTKVRMPPNWSQWGLNQPHAAWRHQAEVPLSPAAPMCRLLLRDVQRHKHRLPPSEHTPYGCLLPFTCGCRFATASVQPPTAGSSKR